VHNANCDSSETVKRTHSVVNGSECIRETFVYAFVSEYRRIFVSAFTRLVGTVIIFLIENRIERIKRRGRTYQDGVVVLYGDDCLKFYTILISLGEQCSFTRLRSVS